MRRVPIAALTACGALVGAACGLSLFGTGSDGATPSDDGGPEANATETGVTDAGNDISAADVAEAGVDASGCPDALPYPELVNVGEFCIDSTEVSVTLFLQFVQSGAAVAPPPVQGCEWKTEYTYADGGLSDKPAFVDWCDAWAYCHWAGKRLCGAIDGGKLDAPGADDPSKSQWSYACTGGDPKHKYPYGDTFDASICGPADAADFVYTQTCQGAFPGVFHMSGNAAEWIDSCSNTDKAADCLVRGGSYLSNGPAQFACAGGPPAKRNVIPPATGFRCCAP